MSQYVTMYDTYIGKVRYLLVGSARGASLRKLFRLSEVLRVPKVPYLR